MAFLAYIHAPEPDADGEVNPRPWEPNWRMWCPLLAAVVVGYAATRANGSVAALLVLGVFALCCQAAVEAVPDGNGLREWRQ